MVALYLFAIFVTLDDIVNLIVGAKYIVELEGEKSWRVRRDWGRIGIMPLVFPWLPRSTPESDPVKWHGILRHASGVFAVGNALKWDQKQRENVGPVRADLNRRIFFSRSRVGWWKFSARLLSTRVLAMLHARQDLAFCGTITSEFISNNHAWDVLEPFEEFPEKSFGSLFVTSALHQDIQHVAILIYRSPQIVPLTTDREKDLVHIPLVAATRATMAKFVGVRLPKFETQLTYGFIGHDDPALWCVVRSSTSRKLSEKRKYNHTAWLMISGGKRKPL